MKNALLFQFLCRSKVLFDLHCKKRILLIAGFIRKTDKGSFKIIFNLHPVRNLASCFLQPFSDSDTGFATRDAS